MKKEKYPQERNYLTEVAFKYSDGDRFCDTRPFNTHTGIQEYYHLVGWIKRLKGVIVDIQTEIDQLELEKDGE